MASVCNKDEAGGGMAPNGNEARAWGSDSFGTY